MSSGSYFPSGGFSSALANPVGKLGNLAACSNSLVSSVNLSSYSSAGYPRLLKGKMEKI